MVMLKTPTCSPILIISCLSLPVITIVGDLGLRKLSAAGTPTFVRALFDSFVHISLGCVAWSGSIISQNFQISFRQEMIFAALISASLDVDHFIMAGSMKLQVILVKRETSLDAENCGASDHRLIKEIRYFICLCF